VAVTVAVAEQLALTFEEESHTYRLGGTKLPSVSRILELRFGALPSAPHIQIAADRGKKAHLACELWDLGDLDEDSIAGTDLAGYLRGWAKWCGAPGEWALIEHRLAGTVAGVTYAGTIDRVGYVRGVTDIKSKGRTTKPPLYDSDEWQRHGMQLAAYAGLLAGTDYAHVDRRQVVYLYPDGHVHPVDYTRFNDRFDEEWRSLLREWRQAAAEENDDGSSDCQARSPRG
jgi:hypothetical protein